MSNNTAHWMLHLPMSLTAQHGTVISTARLSLFGHITSWTDFVNYAVCSINSTVSM